jgi:selT/selW/selH-like putative selenoprotein
LIPSKGGAFEIAVDGKTIYSKLGLKRFPAYQEIPRLIEGD